MESGIKLPEFSVATENDVADFSAYSCKRCFICYNGLPASLVEASESKVCFGDKPVAIITSEKMTETEADRIASALENCKVYRVI
jgi:hypothetical protein